MARNQRDIDAPPERVFAVLADPRCYPEWVVGSKEIRAADPGFPAPGTRFHHTVGVGPLRRPRSHRGPRVRSAALAQARSPRAAARLGDRAAGARAATGRDARDDDRGSQWVHDAVQVPADHPPPRARAQLRVPAPAPGPRGAPRLERPARDLARCPERDFASGLAARVPRRDAGMPSAMIDPVVIAPRGELDLHAVRALAPQLDDAAGADYSHLIVDLSAVTLLRLHRARRLHPAPASVQRPGAFPVGDRPARQRRRGAARAHGRAVQLLVFPSRDAATA